MMGLAKLRSFLLSNEKVLISSFALAFTLFFIAPVSVYQVNAATLNFKLWDVWYVYLAVSLLACLLFAVFGIFIGTFFRYISFVYLLGVVYIWIQGNFLIYDLDKLNGSQIDWSQFQRFHLLEIVVVASLVALLYFFRRTTNKNFNSIVTVLFFFQVGSILLNGVINMDVQQPDKKYALSFEIHHEFSFSSDKNVVIIILDSFRRDVFEDIVTNDPEFRDTFKDFTLFRDVSSGFHQTYPSIPFILSGRQFDNSTTAQKYLEDAFSNSIPVLLKQNGFNTEVYSMFQELYGNAPDIWDNGAPMTWEDLKTVSEKQFLLTFIRYSPLFLKPYFVNRYYSPKPSTIDLIEFYNNSSKVAKSNRRPTFKLFHLRGVHPNFLLDENFEMNSEVNWYSFEGYLGQAKASLKGVSNLIDHMKAAGVYDNTMIIVMGDHGYPSFPEDLRSASPDFFYNRPSFLPGTLPYFASPMLVIKRFSQRNDALTLSNSSVSVGDLPKTISEELKLPNDFPGVSIFNTEAEKIRTRRFFYYNGPDHQWGSSYLPLMFEFHINGPVWELQSWKFTGKTYSDKGVEEINYPIYEYGSNMIQSVLMSDLGMYLSVGIGYDPTNGYSWASAPTSCIYLHVEPVKRELFLSFAGQPFLAGELQDQTMIVYLDETLVASFTKESKLEVRIPPSEATQISSDRQINLCMAFPDVNKSPKDFGINRDTRWLGYNFNSIVLK